MLAVVAHADSVRGGDAPERRIGRRCASTLPENIAREVGVDARTVRAR